MEKGIDSDEYGGHKRTRFPCLATARYAVAGVVSMLTVAVVVMVTIVALRPQKVIFSIPYQFIEADRLWWHASGNLTTTIIGKHTATTIGGGGGGGGGGKVGGATATTSMQRPTRTYSAAKNVSFLVSFTADNPSGRADVLGQNVTIRVLDMPSYGSSSFSFAQALTQIVEYKLQDHFSVNRQTSHTLRKWIPVDDAAVSYLAEMYGGWNTFTAMVEVTATIVTSVASVKEPGPQIYYCWPVIVGMSSGYDDDRSTSCRPKKEMDTNVSISVLPVPAPAPAPTAAAPR